MKKIETIFNLVAIILAVSNCFSQTKIDIGRQGRNFDFSNAPSTLPFQVGTTLPSTCNTGAAFFKSDETAGRNLYICTYTDEWTRVDGLGGPLGSLVPGTVGGIVITEDGANTELDADTAFLATQGGNNDFSGNNRVGLGFDHLSINVPNDGFTGTTLYKLAKLTGAPSAAEIASTSDTSGIVGVVVSGAGTTGNARIAIRGRASCLFDNATTAGNWAAMSTVTDGNCRDVGTTEPASGIIVGRVLTTNGGAGTYEVLLDGRMSERSTIGGGSPSKYADSFSFTAAISVSGVTHGLGTCDLQIAIYDDASPAQRLEPDYWTCDDASKDVYISFLSPQSGRYVIQ